MRTIDWYIIRSFLYSVLLWSISLMTLRILGDVFANMDEFAERGTMIEVIKAIVYFYGIHCFEYIAQLGGVTIVLAAAFTVARMSHTNELTAMLASGMSLHRVVWPIIVCAMLLGGLVIVDQEFVIPALADQLILEHDATGPEHRSDVVSLVRDDMRVWYANDFHAEDGTMISPLFLVRSDDFIPLAWGQSRGTGTYVTDDPDLPDGWRLTRIWMASRYSAWEVLPDTENIHTSKGAAAMLEAVRQGVGESGGEIPSISFTADKEEGFLWPVVDETYNMTIEARRAHFELAESGALRGCRLEDVRFHFYLDINPAREDDDEADDEDVDAEPDVLGIFLASEAVWVADEDNPRNSHWVLTDGQLLCPSDLRPEDLLMQQSEEQTEYMSSAQLARLLEGGWVRDRESAELTKHVRVADPVNNLVMLLLGLPFILSRERNIKVSFGLCLLMVGSFFAFIYICRFMDIAPFWRAFLPILLFGPVSVVMLDAVKT